MNEPQPIPMVVGMARMRDARLRADLVTIIDFCDSMARGIDAGADDVSVLTLAIREAHDITHVPRGGYQTMSWATAGYLSRHDDNVAYGPAWPDVRAHMADVLARAEEMTR